MSKRGRSGREKKRRQVGGHLRRRSSFGLGPARHARFDLIQNVGQQYVARARPARDRAPRPDCCAFRAIRLVAEGAERAKGLGQRGKGAAPGEDILTPLEPSLGARREQPSQGLILQRRQSVKRQPVARSILPRCRGPGRPFSTTLWPISEAFPTRPRAHGNPRAGLSKPLKKHGSGSQWLRVWSHR